MAFQQDITSLQAPDVSNYAETARITSIEFTNNNFNLTHTKEVEWPNAHVPGWGDGAKDSGDIEWTLWVVLPVGANRWITTGCIEFWEGKKSGVGGPFSDAAKNWYYFVPEMVAAPQGPGTMVGFFVTQGDFRRKNVTGTGTPGEAPFQERSNVVFVAVPQGEWTYRFDTGPLVPAPVPVPEPVPVPVPTPTPEPPAPPPPPPPAPINTSMILNMLATLATHDDITRLRQEIIDLAKQLASVLTTVPVSPATPAPSSTVVAAATAAATVNTIASIFKLFGKK